MTSVNPEVSIVISVYDQLEYTKRCLQDLETTLTGKISFEVLIVDDASKEETKIFLQSLEHPYRVFYNKSNQGFAKNNNFAARKASAKYLCFLNNDVFVRDNWLLPMLQVFKNKEDVGMVGNIQKLSGSLRYDHMGIVFSPEGKPRHYGQGFFYRPFKGMVKKWSAVTAACCVTDRELFLKEGGFDENYLNGCEDIDFCLRMTEINHHNYVVHDSVVLHVKCASEGRKLFNERNSKLFLERWSDLIKSNQSIVDQFYHAKTYIFYLFFKPWSVNFRKWIESILIFLRFKKLS